MANELYQDLPLGYVLLAFTGAYDNTREYCMFEHVTQPDGKSYVYINETPSMGNTPPNDAYWMLFSNVGDLTELKGQLSAAISRANGLSDTLTATIDERLAALTEAGGTELAEVVDARLGAASLRERMTSVRAMWMHSFFQTTGKIYSVSFDNTTMASVGTRGDDAADMHAAPSTDTERGANDFDDVPVFHSFRANGYVDASGEFVLTAIEGEPAFRLDGSHGDVWTLFKPCWFRVVLGDTDTYSVSDEPHGEGWFPSPGLVRQDGTLRPFLPIATYKADIDKDGIPHSRSGACPAHHVSHNNSITTCRKKGAQYCGETSKDRFHLTTLMEIEYATRNEKSVVYGCLSYSSQYAAAVPETGVERIILTASQASNIIVGSCVSIGNPSALSGGNLNLDRNYASMSAKADRVLVTSKEELADGNVAVYVDNGGVTFDTTVGSFVSGDTSYDAPTYISTMPWWTGSTDCVLGPTGSPGSLTSGKYDMRYRYVETVWGNQYSVLSDVVHQGDQMYVCDDSTKFATSLTSDYEAVGYKMDFTKLDQWAWQSRMGFDPAHPSVMEATECNANSTTGYCSARYLPNNATSVLAVWAGCNLNNGNNGGPRARNLNNGLTNENWNSSLRISAILFCPCMAPGFALKRRQETARTEGSRRS